MPQQDDLERYENTEARELLRLFAAVRPAQEKQAPPDFRVKVLNRIEQRRARRGFLAGVTRLLTPAWVPVLAAGLLLSLSANVWLGFWAPAQRAHGDRQVATTSLTDRGSEALVTAYRFQAGIKSDTALDTLVASHSVIEEQAVTLGFAAKPERSRFFISGILYAETLAALRSNNLDLAAQRLQTLEKELGDLQVPRALPLYVSEMRPLLENRRYTGDVFGEFLSLVEPLYAVSAGGTDTDGLTLFRAGAWVENMVLAAAAGDRAALRQGHTVQYLHRELKKLNAPKGVFDALEQLSGIMAKQDMTDRDVKEVLKLVKKMQTLLG
jgi:hypothetical protein